VMCGGWVGRFALGGLNLPFAQKKKKPTLYHIISTVLRFITASHKRVKKKRFFITNHLAISKFLPLSKNPRNLKYRQGTNPTRRPHRDPNKGQVKDWIKCPSSQSTGNSGNTAHYGCLLWPPSPDFHSYHHHALLNHPFPSFRASECLDWSVGEQSYSRRRRTEATARSPGSHHGRARFLSCHSHHRLQGADIHWDDCSCEVTVEGCDCNCSVQFLHDLSFSLNRVGSLHQRAHHDHSR